MDITEFDYDILPDYPFICLVSRRRSGKSTAILDITYSYFIKKKKYRRIYIFCPTARLTNDYKFIQDEYIYDDLNEDDIDDIFESQKRDIQNDPKSKHLNTLLIFDDVTNSLDRKKIDLIGKVSAMGRHLRCSVLFASQSRFNREVSPLIRANLDLLILWKQSNYETIKDIAQMWLGGSIDNKKEAIQIVENVPHKFRSMVIDNSVTENKITDYVYHYTFKLNSIPKDYKFYR